MDRYSEWLDSLLEQDTSQEEHQRYHGLITGQLSRRSLADLVVEVLASDVSLGEFSEYWSEVVDSGCLPTQLAKVDAITYLLGLKELSTHRDSGPMALTELAQSASTQPWVSSLAKAYRDAMLTGADEFDISPDSWLQEKLTLAVKGQRARLRSWCQLGTAGEMSREDLPAEVRDMATGFSGRVNQNISKTLTTKEVIQGVEMFIDVKSPFFKLWAGSVDEEVTWIEPRVETHARLGLNVEMMVEEIFDEVVLAIECPDVQTERAKGQETARVFVGTWLVKGPLDWHGWIPLDAKATLLNMDIQSAFVLTKSPKSQQSESPVVGVDVFAVGDEEDRTMSEGSESPFESGM